MRIFLLAAIGFLVLPSASMAADWAKWRGPNGNHVAPAGQSVPTEWNKTQNVVWKVEVPGRGHSSPTVIGDLIILTSADEQNQQQGVFAFDRATGKRLWGTVVSTGGFPKIHTKNTHASSTACSDGKQIYATFNHHYKIQAVALDMSGKIVWTKDVGRFAPEKYKYGYAASPTLHNDTLIIAADCDTEGWLKSLDTKTGNVVWQQQRPKKLNWGSPIVANVSNRLQLLLGGCDQIASYDPETGKPLWATPCLTMATGGTVVWDEDTVYGSGGFPDKVTVAVKADGSGQIPWENGVKCYEQSMLIHNDYLYAVDDGGVAFCWHAKTGREMWKERLRGPVSASPVLVGDTIYASNERGTTFVFKANPQRFEAVARNQLGTESFATATVIDSRIYLRVADGAGQSRRETLYAIGNASATDSR
ncbi:PQQ-binding-like beta-propeller repeat protein [Fuerstiella marisgermanici]|uniref:Polyvinylalcohol dehydrogenase n=1 Tax=Fuerstiella marisgermanici TaxID=1891926 RepID=A0A1P8WSH4_9PLAN|nr:PQQ-binding-like beta-propeller repeat protein [Fuerstiella marisgermanici]APZ96991.1 Polyvinylalcohol dehydrogenase precursor [Fuerstiella marisgermanici]